LTEAISTCTLIAGTSVVSVVNVILRKGAEEARNRLLDLLDSPQKGRSTIVTRHRRPVAALVPTEAYGAVIRQPLVSIGGSGRGLWGKRIGPACCESCTTNGPLEDLLEDALVLIGSAPLVYRLKGHPELGPCFTSLFEAHAAGRLRFAATAITVAKVPTGPLQAGDDALVWRYHAIVNSWQPIALDVEIAESAARLWSSLRLKLADAVQVAAALAVNAAALVTRERDLSRVSSLYMVS
jgi:predicted nucleic acid-binding protein